MVIILVVIGEIIEVPSLLKLSAQQTSDYGAIEFGTFIKIEISKELVIVAIVSDFKVLNPEINTYPRPKKIDQEDIATLFPDLFDQFPTIISLEVIGYVKDQKVLQDVPPLPPKIYTPIQTMSDPEIFHFHQDKSSNSALMEYILRLRDDNTIKSRESLTKILVTKVTELFGLDVEKILKQL